MTVRVEAYLQTMDSPGHEGFSTDNLVVKNHEQKTSKTTNVKLCRGDVCFYVNAKDLIDAIESCSA